MVVAAQVFWMLAIGALGRVLLAAGHRRLEVQGG
jgi:ABC-2 type transport system permease protein